MTMRFTSARFLLAAAALLLFPLPLLAEDDAASEEASAAQEEQAQPPAEQQKPEVPEVSDEQLSQFTNCYMQVQQIRQRYDGLLADVESPAEAEQIQQRAVGEMTEAITDAGMDIEGYNTVAAAIAQDPEVNARFSSMLQQKQAD